MNKVDKFVFMIYSVAVVFAETVAVAMLLVFIGNGIEGALLQIAKVSLVAFPVIAEIIVIISMQKLLLIRKERLQRKENNNVT